MSNFNDKADPSFYEKRIKVLLDIYPPNDWKAAPDSQTLLLAIQLAKLANGCIIVDGKPVFVENVAVPFKDINLYLKKIGISHVEPTESFDTLSCSDDGVSHVWEVMAGYFAKNEVPPLNVISSASKTVNRKVGDSLLGMHLEERHPAAI